MALKAIGEPFNIFSNITVSGITTYTSSNTSIKFKDTVGYQINFISGTPTGILQINGSVDYNPGLPQSDGSLNAGNWATISSISVGPGTNSPVIFNLTQLGMAWVQCQFITSTASGVISGFTMNKSLG